MRSRWITSGWAAIWLLSGCAKPAVAPPDAICALPHEGLDATLWVQTSAEFEAAAHATFANATRAIDAALADPTWTAAIEQGADFSRLPPAVIVDIDETVLDNSAHQGRVVLERSQYTPERWSAWLREPRAKAVPGALDFARYASSKGVAVFYVTNRSAETKSVTRRNLVDLGFPVESDDTIVCKGDRPEFESSDKGPRRRFVASSHRVLVLVGDDLNDFVAGAKDAVEARRKLVGAHLNRFGTRWFVIPNPMYGSWEQAVSGFQVGQTRDQALRAKFSTVQGF